MSFPREEICAQIIAHWLIWTTFLPLFCQDVVSETTSKTTSFLVCYLKNELLVLTFPKIKHGIRKCYTEY